MAGSKVNKLTPIPNGYHESRYDNETLCAKESGDRWAYTRNDNKLFWRLKRGIDGPISDDRKPTSVHDSEGGATSKILPGGFFKGPPEGPGVLLFLFLLISFFLL
jgi:hypothetical protein